MELHEVVKKKFGGMNKKSLRMVIVAMSPCTGGLEWFDHNFDGDFSGTRIKWLSWFAAPYLSDADLRDADLGNARYDKFTQWPVGFNVEASGAREM